LLDKSGELKNVTLALDHLAIEERVFNDLTVLFDFQFDNSASFENFLFPLKVL
jgi:hypothetical protein